MIKFPVLETAFVLFGFHSSEDRRQRVAEVHGTDFFPLGCSCPVVAHTAAHRKVLLVKVDVLPSQAADLSYTKRRGGLFYAGIIPLT